MSSECAGYVKNENEAFVVLCDGGCCELLNYNMCAAVCGKCPYAKLKKINGKNEKSVKSSQILKDPHGPLSKITRVGQYIRFSSSRLRYSQGHWLKLDGSKNEVSWVPIVYISTTMIRSLEQLTEELTGEWKSDAELIMDRILFERQSLREGKFGMNPIAAALYEAVMIVGRGFVKMSEKTNVDYDVYPDGKTVEVTLQVKGVPDGLFRENKLDRKNDVTSITTTFDTESGDMNSSIDIFEDMDFEEE